MRNRNLFINNILWDLKYNYSWLIDNIEIADEKSWYYHIGCVNTSSFVLSELNYNTEKLDHEVNKMTRNYKNKKYNCKYENLEVLYESEF